MFTRGRLSRLATAAAPVPGRRVWVPVLSAVHAAGRSTLAALLAAELGARARTLVLDTAPRTGSPWSAWIGRPGTGSAALPDRNPLPADVHAAVSRLPDRGDGVAVLTDVRPLDSAPLPPKPIAVWLERSAATTHLVVLADTADALLPPLVAAANGPVSGTATGLDWLAVDRAVPVLCVPATARGLDDALAAVTLVERLDLDAGRLVVALAALAHRDLPRRVLAALTLLEARVAAVVHLGYDRRIQGGSPPAGDARLPEAGATGVARSARLEPSLLGHIRSAGGR